MSSNIESEPLQKLNNQSTRTGDIEKATNNSGTKAASKIALDVPSSDTPILDAAVSNVATLTHGGTTEEIEIKIFRDGKDEMNLVEHPFAMLSLGINKGAVIDLTWEQRHPRTHKPVKSSWRVIGHPKLGLPGPLEEKLYVVLMKLTREQGMPQVVSFARSALLNELGWNHCKKSYCQLENAFLRIGAVNIEAKNSFWNATSKNFDPLNQFALIDNINFVDEPSGRRAQGRVPLSSFRWNDVIFRSMTNGHIRSLDTSFALSLQLPLALRLFRYLDKKRYSGRKNYDFDLRRLCEIHLGMTYNPYPSKYKERLASAHDELIHRGFLQGVSYLPMKTKDGEKVRYKFPSQSEKSAPYEEADEQMESDTQASSDLQTAITFPAVTVQPGKAASKASPTSAPPVSSARAPSSAASPADVVETALLQRLLALQITPAVAEDLLGTVDHGQLQVQLDCLEERDPKNPAAVFIKAVRESWQLPTKYVERLEAQNQEQELRQRQEAQKIRQQKQVEASRLKEAAQEADQQRLDALWEQLDDSTRESIEAQARQRLGVLGQSGRAQGALVAMRRNLLRERLGQPKLEVPQA